MTPRQQQVWDAMLKAVYLPLLKPRATASFGDPPVMSLSALAKQSKMEVRWEDAAGARAGELSWDERMGRSGVVINGGLVELEQNPELHPWEARGFSHDPGLYWDLKNTGEVAAALKPPRQVLASTPVRLSPPTLPEWATPDDHALARLQYQIASRWWSEWEQDGSLFDWIFDALYITPLCGFVLGELVADWRTMTLSNGLQIECLHPKVPQTMLPSVVRYWVTCGGELRGILGDWSATRDWGGNGGPGWAFMPVEKFILVTNDRVANNFEGESVLRPVVKNIEVLRLLHQLQALGAQVHSLGELWFVQEFGTGPDNPDITHEQRDALVEILDNREAVFVPGGILPPGVKPVYANARDNVPDLSPQIATQRTTIAMALQSDHQLIALQGVGARSAKEEAAAGNRDLLDYPAWRFIARPLEELLRRFLALVLPGCPIWCPSVEWGVVEEQNVGEWIDRVEAVVKSGLDTHPEYGAIVREMLDLPAPSGAAQAATAATSGELDPELLADAATPDRSRPVDPNAPLGEMPRYVSPRRVAEHFDVSVGSIVALIKRGDVAGQKVGSRWRVEVHSLERYMRQDIPTDVENAAEADAGDTAG